MKRKLNQKLIYLIEYYNLINANLLVSNAPLQRSDNITSLSGSKKIENTLGAAAETLIKFFRAEEEDIYKNMTAKEIMEHVHSHYKKTI